MFNIHKNKEWNINVGLRSHGSGSEGKHGSYKAKVNLTNFAIL